METLPATLVAVAVLATAPGCKPEESGIEQNQTEGSWTGGPAEGSDSADTTESGELQVSGCIDSSEQGLNGLKHWCWGEYDLTVEYTISHPLDLPQAEVRTIELPPVNLANDSTYDDPFAMACCSDVSETGWEPGEDTCGLVHHRACYSDVIEHICQVIRTVLSDDKQGLGACAEDAVEGSINWLQYGGYGDPEVVGSGEQQCYDFFWETQGLFDVDYCAEPDNFFNDVVWAPSHSFAACLGSTSVSDLTVTISLIDIHPTALPEEGGQTCTGPEENDGLSPPVATLPPGSIELPAEQPVSIDVTGPRFEGEVITGTGRFGISSTMNHHLDPKGALVLDGWNMLGATPTSAGTSIVSLEVPSFRLSLVGPKTTTGSSGRFSLGPGEALFHLYASIDGAGDAIDALNATTISLYPLAAGHANCASRNGCWVSRPFTIEYLDVFGELWQVDIGWGYWAL